MTCGSIGHCDVREREKEGGRGRERVVSVDEGEASKPSYDLNSVCVEQ